MEISALAPSALNPSPMPPAAVDARIERAAKDFEALVLAELLAPIFDGVDSPAIAGGGGTGEKAFSSLLTQEYARTIAERGGFGVADAVKTSLIDMQAARQPRHDAGDSR